ncbi:hypothetical protein [Phytohabitans kaempferiae]|uniref:Secreted protein n=1 Tax=Phytohabitans kaempferiae TaxID=1620943 RepID=A0ABV6M2J2_9ACTN
MKFRTPVVVAAVVVAAAAIPQVRRGLARLLLLTTGTVVRDQRRLQ